MMRPAADSHCQMKHRRNQGRNVLGPAHCPTREIPPANRYRRKTKDQTPPSPPDLPPILFASQASA